MSLLKQKTMRRLVAVVLMGLLTIVVAACSSDTTTTQTATPTARQSKLQTNTGGSSIKPGTARLEWNAQTHELTVTMNITGLDAMTVHPNHIHAGTCEKSGNILYPLRDLMASPQGTALVTTVIPGVMNGIPATGWHFMIHHGPGLLTPQESAVISCGDIYNPNHLYALTVKMTPMRM